MYVRNTRLKKYRVQNRLLIMIGKIVLIFYLFIVSISYLASDTVAYFNGPKRVSNIMLTAGTWEEDEEKDESSLAFLRKTENEAVLMCPTTVEVELTNQGEGPMITEGSYDIYYTETGDPQQDGEKLALPKDEGVIEILEHGETTTLAYEAELPGIYVFVAYQHYETVEEDGVWSEGIQIVCADETEQETEEENTNDEQDEEDQANTDDESDEQETNVNDEQNEESEDTASEETKEDDSSLDEETDAGSTKDPSNVDAKENKEDGTGDEQEKDDEMDE